MVPGEEGKFKSPHLHTTRLEAASSMAPPKAGPLWQEAAAASMAPAVEKAAPSGKELKGEKPPPRSKPEEKGKPEGKEKPQAVTLTWGSTMCVVLVSVICRSRKQILHFVLTSKHSTTGSADV